MSPADTTAHPAGTTFELRFTAIPRSARLPRRLTGYCLGSWGYPYGSTVSDNASLVVAEFAANAVTHGRGTGQDALLRLALIEGELRVEVSDARAERRLALGAAGADEEAGRDLLIVGALAETRGVALRTDAPGRLVWAVLARKAHRPRPDADPPGRPTATPTPGRIDRRGVRGPVPAEEPGRGSRA